MKGEQQQRLFKERKTFLPVMFRWIRLFPLYKWPLKVKWNFKNRREKNFLPSKTLSQSFLHVMLRRAMVLPLESAHFNKDWKTRKHFGDDKRNFTPNKMQEFSLPLSLLAIHNWLHRSRGGGLGSGKKTLTPPPPSPFLKIGIEGVETFP